MASTNCEVQKWWLEYHADQHTSKPISQAHCDSMTEDILDRGRPRVATDHTVSPTVDDTAGIAARLKGGKAIGEDPLPNELFKLDPQATATVGGMYKEIPKGIGHRRRCESYRRVLTSSCPAKVFGKYLRVQLLESVGDSFRDTQCATGRGKTAFLFESHTEVVSGTREENGYDCCNLVYRCHGGLLSGGAPDGAGCWPCDGCSIRVCAGRHQWAYLGCCVDLA